eukprot:g3609.t1
MAAHVVNERKRARDDLEGKHSGGAVATEDMLISSPMVKDLTSSASTGLTGTMESSSLRDVEQERVAQPFGIKSGEEKSLGVDMTDVHMRMREVEMLNRKFVPGVKYLKYRRVLVDWMCEAGDEFNLNNSTMHVAVNLLDRVLQGTVVARNRYQLVAMCCIIIAAKYEEVEEAVPTPADMTEYAQGVFTIDHLISMEVIILNKLKWELRAITPLHFIGYYCAKGVLFDTDHMQGKPLVDKVPRYMKKYCDFFADLCLQEYAFQQYVPSVLAASIILAARRALRIRPLWREELSTLTEHEDKTIMPCYDHVWKFYQENFPSASQAAEESELPSPQGVDEV